MSSSLEKEIGKIMKDSETCAVHTDEGMSCQTLTVQGLLERVGITKYHTQTHIFALRNGMHFHFWSGTVLHILQDVSILFTIAPQCRPQSRGSSKTKSPYTPRTLGLPVIILTLHYASVLS